MLIAMAFACRRSRHGEGPRGAPNLRVVSNMAVGYNNFDMQALNAHGVLGTNTPDVLNESTADFGWSLMMAAARRIAESEHFLRAGKWARGPTTRFSVPMYTAPRSACLAWGASARRSPGARVASTCA